MRRFVQLDKKCLSDGTKNAFKVRATLCLRTNFKCQISAPNTKQCFQNLYFCRNDPTTSYEPFTYSGKYITSVKYGFGLVGRTIVSNCSMPEVISRNVILHVKCPDVCGQRLFKNKDDPSWSTGLAVTGSHPWLVSLHLNRTFVCAGSIIDRKWVKIFSSTEEFPFHVFFY